MYGTRSPYGRPAPPVWFRWGLIILAGFILLIFIVDKLFSGPDTKTTTPLSTIIGHLERHEVKRVMIPADLIAIELTDGKRLTTQISSERDLWPAIRRSGADVTIVASGAPQLPMVRYIYQFIPYLVFALLALFIVRMIREVRR